MSQKKNPFFIWIDDQPDREKIADALQDQIGLSKKFINVKGKDLRVELNSVIKQPKPDLVIIDHVLDKTSRDSLIKFGSTVAELMRDTWPTCPIVGISAAKKKLHISVRQERIYDE